MMFLCQLPDEFHNCLVKLLETLGAAWFANVDDRDLAKTAARLDEARRLICTVLEVPADLPVIDSGDTSRQGIQHWIIGVFENVDAGIKELESAAKPADGSDGYAAACAWVASRGERRLRAAKSSLDRLLSTGILQHNAPHDPRQAN